MTREEAIRHIRDILAENNSIKPSMVVFELEKEALYMAIKALEQTRWISVSEKLPASDEDVLITNGIGIYVGWIDATDKGWRVDSEMDYFMNDIVAWQPLPEPYKAESEEG